VRDGPPGKARDDLNFESQRVRETTQQSSMTTIRDPFAEEPGTRNPFDIHSRLALVLPASSSDLTARVSFTPVDPNLS